MASIQEPLLRVEDLKTHFFLDEGVVRAVDGVTFTVPRGKTVCVVGESGCGKSITARSVLGLVESPGRVVSGHVWWNPARPDAPAGMSAPAGASPPGVRSAAEPAAGPATRRRRGRPPRDDDPGRASGPVDLAALDSRGEDLRRIRGNDISMVFQEPMASLSPMYTVAHQLIQAIRVHERADRQEAFERGVSLLSRVGIPRPEQRMDSYPFQLSGGMCQRVMIAIAIACGPSLLIADEPTTALDVTTQARIIDLLRDLQRATGMSMLFITHDLGVVAEVADEVVVMYLGTVVEQGGVDEIFHDPKHPYTRALLASIPTMGAGARRRPTSIRGQVPHPLRRPRGCPFHPRCDSAIPGLCDTVAPPTVDLGDGRRARCVLYDPKLVAEHTRPAPGDRTSDDGSQP